MSEDDPPCSFVVDSAALHEIASTQSNSLRACCLDCLAKGIIGVPVCVWQEFAEMYEDEATALQASIARKIRMNKRYQLGAASIAERANSGFSLRPYDSHTDLYVASICQIEGHILLTTAAQVAVYKKMTNLVVMEITGWATNYRPSA
jgi:hypothetical protein